MNNVVQWIKSNVFIVVFVVLMIAALVMLPLFSGKLNVGVQEEVKSRANEFNKLKQLQNSTVVIPTAGPRGEEERTIINDALLREYERVVTVLREDADEVLRAAVEHNRKGRGVLMANVFPEPPAHLVETIPRQFYDTLVRAYEQLVNEVGGGEPPALDSLAGEIARARARFLTQTVAKNSEDDLTEEEKRRLREELANVRLQQYVDVADQLGMYLTTYELVDIPVWDQTRLPSVAELFNWQWKYWIISDVLRGLAEANAGSESIPAAPVKRVIWAEVTSGLPAVSTSSFGTPSGAPRMGQGGAGQFGGGGASSSDGAKTSQSAGPPDPAAQVASDYAVSFTGRKTNPLYDVIYVNLEIVVDSARLPDVIDALSRQNFFTVTDVQLQPRDPFEDLKEGYVYGTDPVVHVVLTIETIWLRTWTKDFMPPATRETLGIPPEQPAAATDA